MEINMEHVFPSFRSNGAVQQISVLQGSESWAPRATWLADGCHSWGLVIYFHCISKAFITDKITTPSVKRSVLDARLAKWLNNQKNWNDQRKIFYEYKCKCSYSVVLSSITILYSSTINSPSCSISSCMMTHSAEPGSVWIIWIIWIMQNLAMFCMVKTSL